MNDVNWPPGAAHPSLSLLLLHIEGELQGDNAKRIDSHVTHCWECRTECEHLRQGIFQYMEFQTAETLPPPPAGRGTFSRRLAQIAGEEIAPRTRPGYLSRVAAGAMSAFTPPRRILA